MGALGSTRKRQEPRSGRKRTPPTYASLKRLADRVFSEWVRRRDSDSEGMVACFTCGAVLPWRTIQAGHFVSRVHLSTRWDEKNVQSQCMADNIWKRGSPAEFALALQRKYGPNIIAELVEKKRQSVKLTRAALQAIIEDYSGRLTAMPTQTP